MTLENWEAIPAPVARQAGPCCRLMEQSRNGWRFLARVSDSLLKDSREWIGELEQERDTLRARLAEAEAERDRLDSECRRVAVENLETHLRQRAVIERLKAAVRSEHERGDRLEALVERAGGSWHDRWEQAAKERDTLRARLDQAEAALRFYADPASWKTYDHPSGFISFAVIDDEGETARAYFAARGKGETA